jgi:hypothetical protein
MERRDDPARPGGHPEPPAALQQRPLPLVSAAGPWYRLHDAERDPLYFGRTSLFRFDAPAGEFGALYLAGDPQGAFVETFGRLETGGSLVTTAALARRCLTRVTSQRPLQVVDLTGAGLRRIGADNRLSTGDYQIAQRWALRLWQHPEQPDGVQYRSRHDPSRKCLALFDRVCAVLLAERLGSLLEIPLVPLLAEILETYQYGLIRVDE